MRVRNKGKYTFSGPGREVDGREMVGAVGRRL